MKITSDTLYAQWRNITTLCPNRCDLRWIDLNITPVVDPEILAAITEAQARPGQALYGYDFFLSQIGELIDEHAVATIPRIGAAYLPLKYQKVTDEAGQVDLYDYCIVPKLSRVSAIYAAPDVNFKVLKAKHRFSHRTLSNSKMKFNRRSLQYLIDNEGDDYQQLHREYNTAPPLPTQQPGRPRRASAEAVWLDLNLLAAYTFTKDSVQLLYMPMTGAACESALHSAIGKSPTKDIGGQVMQGPKQVGRSVKNKAQALYSEDLLITASTLLDGGVDNLIRALKPTKMKGIPAEDFTDLATGRGLTDNKDLKKARREAELDELESAVDEDLSAFVFSAHHPIILRNPDPRHASREGDHNPNFLFGYESEFNPTVDWVASVYDEFSGDFVGKTLPEWQTECLIEGKPLMPLEYIPDLFNRGLTSDDVLYLSTLINDATPKEQVNLIIEEFLRTEAELRLR